MTIPPEVILKQIELGPLNNFLYIIGDASSKEVALIDPAWDVGRLAREVDENGYKVVKVLLTHAHPDHVNGLDEALKRYDVPAYICKNEAPFYKPKHPNLQELQNGDAVTIGSLTWQCIATPGHSPGCLCYKYKNVLIVGDTIFIDGCGRCDLPGSDPRQQYHSLYDVLMPLPDEMVLYTGHNYGPRPWATLGEQKQTNPYLQCSSIEEFLQERMGVVS